MLQEAIQQAASRGEHSAQRCKELEDALLQLERDYAKVRDALAERSEEVPHCLSVCISVSDCLLTIHTYRFAIHLLR